MKGVNNMAEEISIQTMLNLLEQKEVVQKIQEIIRNMNHMERIEEKKPIATIEFNSPKGIPLPTEQEKQLELEQNANIHQINIIKAPHEKEMNDLKALHEKEVVRLKKKHEMELKQYRKKMQILEEQLNQVEQKEKIVLSESNDLQKEKDFYILENRKLKKNLIQMEKEFQMIHTEQNKIREKFDHIETEQNIFYVYKGLPNSMKASLNGIFKQEKYENFLACGAQKANIDSLWEFIRNRVLNHRYEFLHELNEILCYFIEVYNAISETPTLEIQQVALKEAFDTARHIRTQDSKPSGWISQVYLVGYKNAINQKIIQKSIVRVD